jgi:CPA1 family monovalent cation:H+ antiporter
MLFFEYILILLAAICLSNLINRFIPVLSVPILQIALGALIALLPVGYTLELNPELFLVLFIAPLIFHVSLLADNRTMWAQRKPILNMAVLLVFVTILLVGYLVNIMIPAIPLAAAFALVAALGPTDAVAVTSVSKRTNIPRKIRDILEGESIVNDASGIVGFQFALAAMLTGAFSPVHATGRFLVVALGGIAVGLALSWIKYVSVRWIRSLGVENVTLHLLIGILTPFVVYLVAEQMHVSGILAVFAAGIAHSFNRDKFNPETVNLTVASESVWSMFSFTLEGLVFIILGTQLPKILTSINQNFSISKWEIISDILLIVLLILLVRFVWYILTIKKKNYQDAEHPVSRWRAGIIFSLSGARGAITLAIVMSIPVFLSDGTLFPERDLIILIASGVIVTTLLITNFIMPLFVRRKFQYNKSADNEAYFEILQNVISELKRSITPENETATAFIVANYHSRSATLQRKQNIRFVDREEERRLRIKMCEWEQENIANMLKRGDVNEYEAQIYLNIIEVTLNKLSKKSFLNFKKKINQFFHHTHLTYSEKRLRSGFRAIFFKIMEANMRYVFEKLKLLNQRTDTPAIRKMMADCEFRLSLYQSRLRQNKVNKEILAAVVSHGFQAERDHIHTMLEDGRISRETAKEIRHNISLLEVQLKKEYL